MSDTRPLPSPWPPRDERSVWEQVDAVMGWYQWCLLAGLLLSLFLVILAYRGLKGRDVLERRPVPLPSRRPPRHRARARASWLASEETDGWWIWADDEPVGRRYLDK